MVTHLCAYAPKKGVLMDISDMDSRARYASHITLKAYAQWIADYSEDLLTLVHYGRLDSARDSLEELHRFLGSVCEESNTDDIQTEENTR